MIRELKAKIKAEKEGALPDPFAYAQRLNTDQSPDEEGLEILQGKPKSAPLRETHAQIIDRLCRQKIEDDIRLTRAVREEAR